MKQFLKFLVVIWVLTNAAFTESLASDEPADDIKGKDVKISVSSEMFSLFMAVQAELPADKAKAFWQELNEFTALLQKKKTKYKSEEAFASYLFYKVHRQYLKKYDHYTTFYHLFDKGSYNCVTGTALYAMLLDAMHLHYQIRETPYHVFLMVYLNQHQDSVLIESTDPYGFISDPKTMKNALTHYQETPQKENPSSSVFTYGFNIDNRINLQKLAGLNYFNQAVDHYNHQRLDKAMQYLNQAMILYPAKRMEAFQSLIYQTAQKISYSR